MKYGSICSGIEAASVAFQPLDWEPAWFSEIEAFPNAVLAHHYPGVQNHGDMSNLADKILAGEIEAPDMICGGPPCQAFSVAGSRQSLSDKRGNLTLEYIRICDANDAVRSADGREATWILYENVPGLLSVSDNAFGAFLGGLVGRTAPIPEPEGGWTGAGVVDGPTRCAAWRILDAKHFGLAQRRKRVFVLARGGAGRWAAADALLPIIEGSRWHPAPSRGTREGVAPTISARTSGGGGLGTDFDLDGGLTVMATGQAGAEVVSDGSPSLTCNHEAPIVFDPAQITSVTNRSNPQPGDPCHTLHQSEPPMLIRMREGKEGGGKGPLVSEDQILAIPINTQLGLRGAETSNTTREGIGIGKPGDPAFTLQANHCHAVATPMLVRMREGKAGGGKGPLVSEDKSLTLATANDQVLAFEPGSIARNAGPSGESHQVPTLRSSMGDNQPAIRQGMQVRRLLPEECETLMGFPRGYTNIPWRGKPESPDGNRYKALGNSWAVPCARWIGERIKAIRPVG